MATSYTNVTWAQQVLSDLGVPTSGNNLTFMLQWMASENSPATWTGTAGANNPLNNGYGSGGGDGTGSYPDLSTAAADVAANLRSGNYGYGNIVADLERNADASSTAAATMASDWASSHYGYGARWNTSASPSDAITQDQSAGSGATGGVSGGTPSQSVGAQYLRAVQAANQADAASNSGTDVIGGQTYTGTSSETSALSTIAASLEGNGFTPQQIAQLVQFSWGEIISGTDPTQIAIDMQNQSAFEQAYPFFKYVNAQLADKGLPAVSVQQYQQYQVQAYAMARAGGFPPGFMNAENVASLMANNVSTSELSSRLNDATAIAIGSTPEQQAVFNSYFGLNYGDTGHGPLSIGQIASLVLDPNHAEPLIKSQITAAQIGGASLTSGVGALGELTAMQLSQAGITTAQATSAFQNLAPYAPLEYVRPGENGEAAQGVVSATQLATGALLGNTAAEHQLQTAVEVGKAPFSGGGGYQQTSKGTVGAGSASSSGGGGT